MIALLTLLACGDQAATEPTPTEAPEPAPAEVEPPEHAKLFGTLPEHYHAAPPTQQLVDLGRMLYYETRLSKNHDVSCNSCHMLDRYGVDNTPTSSGHKEQLGGRNSPTTYNAAMHIAQFWDGRAADVEEQAKGPILNPVEMAMPGEEHVVKVLTSIPGYVEAFGEAFPGDEDPITYDNMAIAIGAFERGLVTRDSPFEEYLKGDTDALNDKERAGLDLFVSTGCASCHNGPGLGGNMYQKLGAVNPYPTEDKGRMEVTGKEADEFMFKVPSLWNVAETHPYFHDGQVESLEEAVKLMGHHQLGKDLTDEQVASIVEFLESTTGELPTEYIAKPALPESGPETPGPDPS